MLSKKHNLHIARIFTLSIVCLILLSADAVATDWFVRPAGGNYGSEDGTSYANAWDGLTNVVWGGGGVVAGDNLYVCGLHVHSVEALDSIATEADITPVSGTSESARVIIRGDYPGDPGIVWGAYKMSYDDWTNEGNGVWSIPLPGDSSDVWFFEDIGTPDDASYTILNPLTPTSGTLTGTWTFTNASTTVTADGDGNA